MLYSSWFSRIRSLGKGPAYSIGNEWKGYILYITDSNTSKGSPALALLYQASLQWQLLLSPCCTGECWHKYMCELPMFLFHGVSPLSNSCSCYWPHCTDEHWCKYMCRSIIGSDVGILSPVVIKQEKNKIPELTDNVLSERLDLKTEEVFQFGKEGQCKEVCC